MRIRENLPLSFVYLMGDTKKSNIPRFGGIEKNLVTVILETKPGRFVGVKLWI
jgi:hypothetical protein